MNYLSVCGCVCMCVCLRRDHEQIGCSLSWCDCRCFFLPRAFCSATEGHSTRRNFTVIGSETSVKPSLLPKAMLSALLTWTKFWMKMAHKLRILVTLLIVSEELTPLSSGCMPGIPRVWRESETHIERAPDEREGVRARWRREGERLSTPSPSHCMSGTPKVWRDGERNI